MKKLSFLLLAIFLMLTVGFVSCKKTENENGFVAMSIVPREISANSTNVVIRMENRTKHTIVWNTPYRIDYFFNDYGWREVWPSPILDIHWINSPVFLAPGRTKEEPRDNFYLIVENRLEGKKGLYRFVRDVTFRHDDTTIRLYAEFEIK